MSRLASSRSKSTPHVVLHSVLRMRPKRSISQIGVEVIGIVGVVRNQGERSLLPGNASTVSNLRVILRTSDTGEGTFLLDPANGYLQVIIVPKDIANQTL